MKHNFLLFCLIAGTLPTTAMETPKPIEPESVSKFIQDYKATTQEIFESEIRKNPSLLFSLAPKDISTLVKDLLPSDEEIESSKKSISGFTDIGATFIKLREIGARKYTVSQDAAKMLALKYNDRIHWTYKNGRTLLHDKVSDGATFEVELLLLAGAPANQGTSDNNITPLYIACQSGHDCIANLLVAAKADVNKARTPDGTTPLFLASFHGHMATVSLLIAANADVNKARTDDNRTPLFPSCFFGYSPIVDQLLKAGADANHKRAIDGITPLHIACDNGHASIVNRLIDAGADANQTTIDGWTPLFMACANGRLAIADRLLQAGADANHKRAIDGMTPLHIAALRNNVVCVQLLLNHSANPTIKMNDGKTAGDIAQEQGHKDIALLLYKAENRV